jgi:hypothetical protein
MTICLKKKYFDSEETFKSASASLSSQDQFLQQECSIAEKTSEEEIHSCGKYSFFLDEDRSYGLFEILFSTRRRLHKGNDNVVSYHKNSVAASLGLRRYKKKIRKHCIPVPRKISLDIETFIKS